MNKKWVSYSIIAVLCLNLLPRPSNAFKLNEAKDDVIYHSDIEKEGWENFYLPYAKHLKLVNKTTTILDIAKKSEETGDISLISEIKNRTHQERAKLIVKWERDNRYIDTESEKNYEITPTIRMKLLKEIEEEEKEQKEKYNFGWKLCKTALTTLSFSGTFGVAKYKGIDTTEATKLTALIFMGLSAAINIAEITLSGTWNTIRRLWNGEEEIKLPPLQNMPELPKDYKKVDVYTYGL